MKLLFLLAAVICQRAPSNVQVGRTAQVQFCAQSGAGEATGQQQRNGGQLCSSTQQGLIPDVNNMISTMITQPQSGATVDASQGFQVVFSVNNFMTGVSVNLQNQFLLSPQTLAGNGLIEGFEQLTIQPLASANRAPAAATTSFFQTLTQASDGNGRATFTVNVPAGQIQTTGLHRICTMAAGAGGQPVVMPVAQRGSQDDCVRVNITNGGGNNAAAGRVRQAPKQPDQGVNTGDQNQNQDQQGQEQNQNQPAGKQAKQPNQQNQNQPAGKQAKQAKQAKQPAGKQAKKAPKRN
jgi:hypothetical protein